MLRIGEREVSIKRLEFLEDTLSKLQNLVSANVTEEVKKLGIKKLTGVNPYCVCGDIPSYEIIYNVENATRIERYCEKCVKSVYGREQVL